jgi:hypothetical protein
MQRQMAKSVRPWTPEEFGIKTEKDEAGGVKLTLRQGVPHIHV